MNLFKKTIAAIGVCITLFCIIAVLDYHPEDPSLLNATNKMASNITSKYGANIADPIVQAFGYSIIIPLLIVLTWCIIGILNRNVRMKFLKINLLIGSIPMYCFLFSVFDSDIISDGEYYNFHYGGYLGYFLYTEAIFSMKFTLYSFIATTLGLISMFFTLGLMEFIIYRLSIKLNNTHLLKSKFTFFNSTKYNQELQYKHSHNLNPDIQFQMHSTCMSESKNKLFDLKSNIIQPQEESLQGFPIQKPAVKQELLNIQFPIKQEANTNFDNFDILQTPEYHQECKTVSKTTIDLQKFTENQTILHNFIIPSTDMLQNAELYNDYQLSENVIETKKDQLIRVLNDFGIKGEITNVCCGPIVTLYHLEPVAGTKSSRVIGLADDIARSMRAKSARVAVIQGQNAIGIELPNDIRRTITLREIIDSKEYQNSEYQLPLALGQSITGETIVADLAKMPHLLIAGTTGSGKSVSLHTMILSLLYKYTPEECRFLMIDPKMLEMSVYDGIPHLLSPVVTSPDTAIATMKWIVKEMSSRYRSMSILGVRNIISYNNLIREAQSRNANIEKKVQTGFDSETKQPIFETIVTKAEILPYIVVIIDEIADLMMVAGKEIENSVQRLAQMARAAGIHLIMATQRPSVDVVTGVIKANFPTRISFQVASKFDSRTILGEIGAEQLLGAGDMLYMTTGGKIERLHGAFVKEEEVEGVVAYIKSQRGPNYLYSIIENDDANA